MLRSPIQIREERSGVDAEIGDEGGPNAAIGIWVDLDELAVVEFTSDGFVAAAIIGELLQVVDGEWSSENGHNLAASHKDRVSCIYDAVLG
jgi:hypothetical protein